MSITVHNQVFKKPIADPSVFPKAVFIPRQCFHCGEPDAVQCITLRTAHPSHVLLCCEQKACQDAVLDGMLYFVRSSLEPILLDPVDMPCKDIPVVVERSNGTVENNWELHGVIFNDTEVSHIVCYQSRNHLIKSVPVAAFISHNGDLREVVENLVNELVDTMIHDFTNLWQ